MRPCDLLCTLCYVAAEPNQALPLVRSVLSDLLLALSMESWLNKFPHSVLSRWQQLGVSCDRDGATCQPCALMQA